MFSAREGNTSSMPRTITEVCFPETAEVSLVQYDFALLLLFTQVTVRGRSHESKLTVELSMSFPTGVCSVSPVCPTTLSAFILSGPTVKSSSTNISFGPFFSEKLKDDWGIPSRTVSSTGVLS